VWLRVLFQLTAAPGSVGSANQITFTVDGRVVTVADDGAPLLEVLRDRLGLRSAKDGCSPQGQCGCCTVWIDGSPRVSCVTPARRVAGRVVTTLDGMDSSLRSAWTGAFSDAGASQCGFCTPGIIMRLAALVERRPQATEHDFATSLSAHLCRCTGWKTIIEAAQVAQQVQIAQREQVGCSRTSVQHTSELHTSELAEPEPGHRARDLDAACRRASIEGRSPQRAGPEIAAGNGGFADDASPDGALVAVSDGAGGWSVADTLTEALEVSKKVQGRNSGAAVSWPMQIPPGDWALSLRTTFVEPAYLEPDASWCEPGREPASPVANGGAFGGKSVSLVTEAARVLAAEHVRPVRVLMSREDVVRMGPKRPPMAAGLRLDGSGVVRVGRTPGSEDLSGWTSAFRAYAPSCAVEVVDVAGPIVSSDIRGAGWVEAAVLVAALCSLADDEADFEAGSQRVELKSPEGGYASVTIADDGTVRVTVEAGEVLDEVVLRSYCVGAVHQGLGWARREAVAVDLSGNVLDLTIRSFRILPARDMPHVEVEVVEGNGPAVNASDAVFAAASAAAWIRAGLPPAWPIES
jgi:xanthine dehydrogenase small subunit